MARQHQDDRKKLGKRVLTASAALRCALTTVEETCEHDPRRAARKLVAAYDELAAEVARLRSRFTK